MHPLAHRQTDRQSDRQTVAHREEHIWTVH